MIPFAARCVCPHTDMSSVLGSDRPLGKAGILRRRGRRAPRTTVDNEPAPAPTVPDAAEESKAPGALKESFGDVLYRRRITAVMLLIMVLAAVGKFGFLSSQSTLITPEELADHSTGDSIWVAIMGTVYDVSRGRQHYGPNGAYSFFAGRDASRGFATGDFSAEGLEDDINNLTAAQLLELARWASFYREHRKYRKVGKLVGRFYDDRGKQTQELARTSAAIRRAYLLQSRQDDLSEQFPACNSRWAEGEPAQVWCSRNSGGVERDWIGFPRLMRKDFDGLVTCVCASVQTIDDPRLRRYAGCGERSTRCVVPDDS